jgi:LAO/AO transport system kinase
MEQLAHNVLLGERRSIARAISVVEDRRPGYQVLLSALYRHTGRARRVGITGASGTGKSTLVTHLAQAYRARGDRVGIIGVDPSSPYTGGALLGDRIRMRDLAGDPGIFIRSMATRGARGGLAQATSDAVQILDAAGYEVILIETVGAGQDEVEIARIAHTTLVIEAPGLGDDIQAIKAGLIEVADVLVVNKADLQGADQAVYVLQDMLALAQVPWMPPICKTVALDGTGIDDLVAAIAAHQTYLQTGPGERRERARVRRQIEGLVQEALLAQFLEGLPPGLLDDIVSRVAVRDLAPHEALAELGL